jgi:DNA-binding MarR family transcriptional regulator
MAYSPTMTEDRVKARARAADEERARAAARVLFESLTSLTRGTERLHSRGDIRARSGVDLPRWLHPVIFVLAARGPIRVRDLADQLAILHSTASRHVNQLERLGLVRRSDHPHDRRAITVDLTDDGRRLCAALSNAWAESFAAILADWAPEQVLELSCGLDDFASSVVAYLEGESRSS